MNCNCIDRRLKMKLFIFGLTTKRSQRNENMEKTINNAKTKIRVKQFWNRLGKIGFPPKIKKSNRSCTLATREINNFYHLSNEIRLPNKHNVAQPRKVSKTNCDTSPQNTNRQLIIQTKQRRQRVRFVHKESHFGSHFETHISRRLRTVIRFH